MNLEISPETHCSDCGEIIHNHFNCPICKARDAGTDAYHNMWEWDVVGSVIKCENCGTAFKLINRESADIEEWVWEIVGDKDG